MDKFYLTEECCDADIIEIAQVLLRHVIKYKTVITYGDLARELSFEINPRNLDRPLGCISEVCLKNGVPPISAMVVNKDKFIPGAGFFKCFYPGLKPEDYDTKAIELINQVTSFDQWDTVLKAFE